MPNDKWKDVLGWEGLYKVSTSGAVFSYKSRKVLNAGNMIKGYPHVTLCSGQRRKAVNVHDIVMMTFIGPKPINREVCHNDGNKKNCALINLRYDTQRENLLDRARHGWSQPKGFNSKLSKISKTEAIWSNRIINRGEYSIRALAIMFGVSHSTLRTALRNLRLIKDKKI
jgi:hypothetical protein